MEDDGAAVTGDGGVGDGVEVRGEDATRSVPRRTRSVQTLRPRPHRGVPALFQGAFLLDWLVMGLATGLALLHGVALPAAMFVFGLLTNAFVNQFTSAQLANYEFSFDPLDYIEEGRFGSVDASVILTGFINFTNITGGVVNCSDSYELLPFNQTFDDILHLGVTQLASCLDNPTFLKLVDLYTLIFVALAVAVWVVGGAQVALFRVAGSRQVDRVRRKLYRSVLQQEVGWFDATAPGELSSRLGEDVSRLQDGLGERLGLLVQWLATLVAGVITSLWVEWRLTLLMALAGILIASSTAALSVVSSSSTSHRLTLYATAGAAAEEALSSISTVKAFGGEGEEIKRYTHSLRRATRWGLVVTVVVGGCLGVVQLLVFSCYAGSFWLGAFLIQEEIIQAGQFVTVFFAVLLVGVSVGQALPHVQRLAAAQGAAKSLHAIVNRAPSLITHSGKGVWPDGELKPSIQFQNVSFFYPSRPDMQVLSGVTLSVGAGETVAIVGPTGSGKSTLVQLLLRFYDVSAGQVAVGGYDVRSVDCEKLRGMVGVVSQDPALFQGSIAENIGYGLLGASLEDVQRAAQRAHAHEFITSLPMGYDTPVGEGGTQLSGGQRQRIAIARALIREPKILLLDEATSALDTESERIVQEALAELSKHTTTIIIAHRLSTIQHADCILVMDGGSLVESGTHSQLLQSRAFYYNLVQAQLKGLEMEDVPSPHHPLPAHTSSPLSPTSSLPPTPHLPDAHASLEGSAEPREDTQRVSWFRVLRLSLPEWYLVVGGAMAAAVQGAIFPSFSIFFGRALEAFTFPFNQVLDLTHMWAGLFLALGFISAIATIAKVVSFSVAGERLTSRLRTWAFQSMVQREVWWFDHPSHSPSSLSSLLFSETPLVQGVINSLSSLTEVGVGLLVAMVISLASSWVLALVVLGFVPLLVFAGLVQVLFLRRSLGTGGQHGAMVVVESLAHIRTVKAFGLQDTFHKKYSRAVHVPWRWTVGLSAGFGGVYGFANFIVFIAYAVTFRFAAYLLTLPVDHTLYANFEDIFTVFLAVILGSLAAGQASPALTLTSQALSAATAVLGVMESPEQAEMEEGEKKPPEPIIGALSLSAVHFSFPSRPDVPVLADLSLAVPPGQTLALVGPSGAGKSTVISILERFYSPQAGRVEVDGRDVLALDRTWWRRQLGWVPQEPVLFNRSIAENISYGGGCEVTEEEVVRAATAANIHTFIKSLPQGYSTIAGSKGTQLSGGQRQRIAIARALVREPKILLLDEATSALDTESERIVQEALDKAKQGRTTIVIAHRLSTIAGADSIAVLRRGRVAEVGSHQELVERRGLYWTLLSYQNRVQPPQDSTSETNTHLTSMKTDH